MQRGQELPGSSRRKLVAVSFGLGGRGGGPPPASSGCFAHVRKTPWPARRSFCTPPRRLLGAPGGPAAAGYEF
eukprot:3019526-Lingulodinium_polyedra.AAC.1